MPPQRDKINAAFLAINRDKRAAVLDLKHPDGLACLKRLLLTYDIVLESFRPGVLARLGLSPAQMRTLNPRLIVCSISGYGQQGPLKDRAGHDLNYLARAGVLAVTGPSDRPPAVSGAQMADVAGGALWAVSAICAALFARERTGEGSVLDIAMSEGALPLIAFAYGASMATAPQSTPARGEHFLDGGIAPYANYQTKDGGHVSLAALEPKFWQRFCLSVGLEASMEALVPGPHQAALKAQLTEIFLSKTRDEWAQLGAACDCCLEPILRPDELAQDAQHQARNLFFSLNEDRYFYTPLAAIEHRNRAHTVAAEQGADTEAILRDAGFSQDEIVALCASGAVVHRATA
jgi:crotonobetainyl-CoA:carnitine CoA-transferase CaiB-like acyl-CoA transferase